MKWDEIADESYKNKVEYLRSIYNQNNNFQLTIHNLVENFITKEKKSFSNGQVHRLGEYIIEELPEVINRVHMQGIICDAYVYPSDGPLNILIEKIQKGEEFPEIKEKIMDTDPKVFLQVY